MSGGDAGGAKGGAGTPVGNNHAFFTLGEVLEATGGTPANFGPEGDGVITASVVTDSRHPVPGCLFVALKGETFDGHEFLPHVAEAGCSAALVSTPDFHLDFLPQIKVPDTAIALGELGSFHRARFAIPVVAITGSYGKTSTRALVAAALGVRWPVLNSAANFNNEIGLPLTLLQLQFHHQAAVLEMGMRGPDQIRYLARIAKPTVGLVTNIGPQHIELLGSVENIARAKSELLQELSPEGLAILPADSPHLATLRAACPCRAVTFGMAEDADYRVTEVVSTPAGNVGFAVNGTPIELGMPGAHNAVNAAAAFAVAWELGLSVDDIARGLAGAQLPGARMRVVRLDNGTTIIDDCYNAGPDSMRAALHTLLDFPGGGRRVAILGAMKELGAYSEAEHIKIGYLAGQIADHLIGVGGDTRPLLNAAVASARAEERILAVNYADNAAGAVERLAEWIQPGDLVLVKGSRSVGLEVVVTALRGGVGG